MSRRASVPPAFSGREPAVSLSGNLKLSGPLYASKQVLTPARDTQAFMSFHFFAFWPKI
jgi:hypothetical protein